MKYTRKLFKTMKRRLEKQRRYFFRKLLKPQNILGFLLIGGLFSLILLNMQNTQRIHTAELLTTIAKVESKNNYNAYFGNAGNTSILFTSMTVGEVLAWQKQFVEQGNPSSAVGRYQFIDSTLRGLVSQLNIDQNEKFDPALQDRLAVALLERRGIHDYVNDRIIYQKNGRRCQRQSGITRSSRTMRGTD
jgi:hypothetical protein